MKRVCLLTGASGTLGTDFCRRHAHEYDIVAVYRTQPPPVPSQLQTLVDPLDPRRSPAPNHDPVFAVQADLLRPGEIERVVELTLARFDRVDLLVNAAVNSIWAPMLDATSLVDSAARQLSMNVIVPLQLSAMLGREIWRDARLDNEAANRNVVNLSSIAGVNIYPGLGQSVYSATKAALNFLTLHMADEFGYIGVRVNAIAPNSFPSAVSVESVSEAVVQFDQSPDTGRILVLDVEKEYYL
jgi:NAD(P)-dependent dehydrogenase (short-subunit alcohol dehydrogenase family)